MLGLTLLFLTGKTLAELLCNYLRRKYTLVIDQLAIIKTITLECGAILHHVKPHGALYNLAAKDMITAAAIANAVKDFDKKLIYFGLSDRKSVV